MTAAVLVAWWHAPARLKGPVGFFGCCWRLVPALIACSAQLIFFLPIVICNMPKRIISMVITVLINSCLITALTTTHVLYYAAKLLTELNLFAE
jgi:hypothetical protein